MTLPSAKGATPVMAQWFSLKKEHPDALLFFRMGDFFELFFHDAEAAANALDIALTARGTHAGQPIPMCGVPVGTAATYLARLIKKGFKVAVAEQTESPKNRGKNQKGPLSRAVIRLITPGTLTEDELLNASQPNYILCIIPDLKKNSSNLGAAWIDISTGIFETSYFKSFQLDDFLARINPSEILAPNQLYLNSYENRQTILNEISNIKIAQKQLATLFNINSLSALGDFKNEEIIAGYELITYIGQTQNGRIPQLSRPQSQKYESILAIDQATRNSLEILENNAGNNQFTLFSSINRAITAPGSRMLANWLSSPLTEIDKIEARQKGWIYLYQNTQLLTLLRQTLKGSPDIARSLGRISVGRGSPRDLASIRNGLHVARKIAQILSKYEKKIDRTPPYIHKIKHYLLSGNILLENLTKALMENPPLKLEEGSIIKEGYDEKLDTYRHLHQQSRQIIIDLQQKYCKKYDISTLKIRFSNQLGYIIELSRTAAAKLKDCPELILRQGTVNLARYTTDELNILNTKILEASSISAEYEKILFDKLIEETLRERDLPLLANAIAVIDVLQACATLYSSQEWCVPTLTNDTRFTLKNARHPVVEAALQKPDKFTPNSCNLSNNKRVMLLTGPNMAGKSTFLRQVALNVILAQSGLPLPATNAEIGIVDRLFSRVGASDDLANGRSTFMVEMTEAASILNQAGPRSLVVIDEIGRGTSTLDGLAIAWAILETLHNTIQCRTIFATHFHELSQLTHHLPFIQNFTMKIKEWKGSIIFQYEVVPGAAEHSWGIHVAQLAGVPTTTLNRAKSVLQTLETQQYGSQISLPLSDTDATVGNQNHSQVNFDTEKRKMLNEIETALIKINPDQITPMDAINILYKLKKVIDR